MMRSFFRLYFMFRRKGWALVPAVKDSWRLSK